MFQPVSQSYIHAVAETSIDQHMYETEQERAERLGSPYRELDLGRWLRRLLGPLGLVLATVGRALIGIAHQFGSLPRRRPTLG